VALVLPDAHRDQRLLILGVALAVFVLSTAGLATLVEPIPTWYYHLAWWSYIVAADDLNHRISGRSLLRDRPRHFAWLAFVSVLWWTLFELLNLRLGNWYYVMSLPSRGVRWSAGAVAFASVLPGILETLELFENRGWPLSVRVRPLRWSRAKEHVMVAMGLAFFALPLAWPDVFFPLTWGSFVFLLEPWNRRWARRSFLRDLETGEAAPFLRTLTAGLVCGALWEAWNFWARTKWVYTVPVFERLKLFEMPLAGFLGFPPFAVECVVVLRFLGGLADRLGPARAHRVRAAAVIAGPAAVLVMFAAVDPVVVDSVYVPLARLDLVSAGARSRLSASGITSPERLLRETRDPARRRELAARTGLTVDEVERVRERVALVAHRGIGLDRARELDGIGLRTLSELRTWTPEAIASSLRARRPSDPRNRFLERRARVWFESLGPMDGGR